MPRLPMGMIKTTLTALHGSGAATVLSPLARGVGVIFQLTRVGPDADARFAPHRASSVTPEFLDTVIRHIQDRGWEILSLDGVEARLAQGDFEQPFAAFTFDDGYRDVVEHAYPVLRRHAVPFAVYVATDFADGRGELWWLELEAVIAAAEALELKIEAEWRIFECRNPAQKTVAFAEISQWLRTLPHEQARAIVGDLARLHDLSFEDHCAQVMLSWNELHTIARDPLVTIGAHTRGHRAVSKLALGAARMEIEASVARVAAELDRPCRHFSWPFGDAAGAGQREFDLARELGLATAVTAQLGLLRPHHAQQRTALPRVALRGDLQKLRYVKAMLSGVPLPLMRASGGSSAGYYA